MGEYVEGGAGGEPTGESTPKYEEMTPEQQKIHNEGAPKQEAAKISEEVRLQQEALDFAREKGLNEEALKKNMIDAIQGEAIEDNKIEDTARLLAQTALETMTIAAVTKKRTEVPCPSISPSIESRSWSRMQKILGAKLIDDARSSIPGYREFKEPVNLYEAGELGKFIAFNKPDKEGGGKTLVFRSVS